MNTLPSTRIIVTEKNATPAGLHCQNKWITEASDLGLPPGKWPFSIESTLGNRMFFIHQRVGEDGAHHYQQECGCLELVILND